MLWENEDKVIAGQRNYSSLLVSIVVLLLQTSASLGHIEM